MKNETERFHFQSCVESLRNVGGKKLYRVTSKHAVDGAANDFSIFCTTVSIFHFPLLCLNRCVLVILGSWSKGASPGGREAWSASWLAVISEVVELASRVKWIKLVLYRVGIMPHANRWQTYFEDTVLEQDSRHVKNSSLTLSWNVAFINHEQTSYPIEQSSFSKFREHLFAVLPD